MRELRTRSDVPSSLLPFHQKRIIRERQQRRRTLNPSTCCRHGVPTFPQSLVWYSPSRTSSIGGCARLTNVFQLFKQLHETHLCSSPQLEPRALPRLVQNCLRTCADYPASQQDFR